MVEEHDSHSRRHQVAQRALDNGTYVQYFANLLITVWS